MEGIIQNAAYPGLMEKLPVSGTINNGLKICFIQDGEEVRCNGEGQSFFMTMAEILAKDGHDITVLYVPEKSGKQSAYEDLSEHCLQFGIKVILLNEAEIPNYKNVIGQALEKSYNVYEWLKPRNFDLIHVLDNKGLPYYCLVSKYAGIYFQNTLFCVKAYMPTIWDYMCRSRLITDPQLLITQHLEQKSIELADIVISDNNYMYAWMRNYGYRLAKSKCYIQPDIVIKKTNAKTESADNAVNEIVFFDNLEPYCGLQLFCDAIVRLKKETDQEISITFLGKESVDFRSADYIKKRAKKWSLNWKILSDKNMAESLQYLKQNGRLAVMPSATITSSNHIYNCLIEGIPFIAGNIGKNPELITKESREHVLFDVNPTKLAHLLVRRVVEGIYIPSANFDYDKNIECWKRWHRGLSSGAKPVSVMPQENGASPATAEPLVSVCILHYERPDLLLQSIRSVTSQTYKNIEVILVDDGSTSKKAESVIASLKSDFDKRGWKVIRQENLYLGAARNTGARNARGEYIFFLDDDNYLKPGAISQLVKIATHTKADIITTFSDVFEGRDAPDSGTKPEARIALAGDNLSYGVIANIFGDGNAFIRKEAYMDLGGNSEDFGIGRDDQEFYARAVLNGYRLIHIPEPLYWYRKSAVRLQDRHYQKHAGDYRVVKAYIGATAPYMNSLIMLAQGQVYSASIKEQFEIMFSQGPEIFRFPSGNSENLIHKMPELYKLGKRVILFENYLWQRFLGVQIIFVLRLLRGISGLLKCLRIV